MSHCQSRSVSLTVVSFLVVAMFSAFGQTGELPTGNPLQSPAQLAGEIMAIAVDTGLQCRNASVQGGAGTVASPHTAHLQLSHSAPEELRAFLNRCREKWGAVIRVLHIGQGMDPEQGRATLETKLVFAFQPTGASDTPQVSLDSLLAPVKDLTFFPAFAGQAPQGIQLFGLRFEEGKGTEFQTVAGTIAEFRPLLVMNPLPGTPRSISRSNVLGKEFFTLGLASGSAGLPGDSLLATAEKLDQLGKLQEFGLAREPYGESFWEIRLECQTDDLERVATHLLKETKASPRLWDLSPGVPGGPLSLHLIVRPEASPQPWLWQDVQALLTHPWPAAITEPLQLSGTHKATSLVLAIPVASATSELKEAIRRDLEKRKFFPESQATETSAEGGIETLRWKFTATDDPTGAAGAATSGQLEEFLKTAEILENIPDPQKTSLRLRFPYERLGELFDCLQADNPRAIQGFSLTCQPPGPVEVQFTLLRREGPDHLTILAFLRRLTGAPLPWNRPDADVTKGLILHHLQVKADGTFALTGKTLKSGKIFADLFPQLQKIPDLSEPFFSKGNYRDYTDGERLMTFEVTGRGPASR